MVPEDGLLDVHLGVQYEALVKIFFSSPVYGPNPSNTYKKLIEVYAKTGFEKIVISGENCSHDLRP